MSETKQIPKPNYYYYYTFIISETKQYWVCQRRLLLLKKKKKKKKKQTNFFCVIFLEVLDVLGGEGDTDQAGLGASLHTPSFLCFLPFWYTYTNHQKWGFENWKSEVICICFS
jgi:hypothetical protein